MSQLTAFYRGTGTDVEGRTLAEIWAYSDAELEGVHDFIQWLFPLRERSGFNPDAPLLTDADIAEFRADPTLRANLLRSFEVFLAFLGLRFEGGKVAEAPDFTVKRAGLAPPQPQLAADHPRPGQHPAARARGREPGILRLPEGVPGRGPVGDHGRLVPLLGGCGQRSSADGESSRGSAGVRP